MKLGAILLALVLAILSAYLAVHDPGDKVPLRSWGCVLCLLLDAMVSVLLWWVFFS